MIFLGIKGPKNPFAHGNQKSYFSIYFLQKKRPRIKLLRIKRCKHNDVKLKREVLNIFSVMEVNMIEKMKYIFDYQRFSSNNRLSEMIEEVERRYTALSDEDLFFVSAAGEPCRMDDENVKSGRTT